MEQDKPFALPVDFALAQVLLGVAAGTVKITNLSVEDGYLNLSIRAKVDSIQFNRNGIGRSSDPMTGPIPAPLDSAPTDRKPDQIHAQGPTDDAKEHAPHDTLSEERLRRPSQLEDPDETSALRPAVPELEELDNALILQR